MSKLNKESVIGISALLVHAANIDEIYSNHEKDLIKDFIKSYLENDDANEILRKLKKLKITQINFLIILKSLKKILLKLKKI